MGKAEKLMAPVHPGEILREDFMKPLGLSVNRLALRLARYFKTNAEFWLNLQNFYDLERERRGGKISEIDRQVQPVGADVA